ncbi:TonB-dependent receptor [Ventosimonas gracilis]|uniref:TonB-dependent receptor n=1 Tax=Ventosimonas gracilis TaxID=1680762 RepID=UPI0009A21D8F|nr:TonB-dependent receptor [Ventosimonas gracilis]
MFSIPCARGIAPVRLCQCVLATACGVWLVNPVQAQQRPVELDVVTVTANPIVEEIHIDTFSVGSAVVTQEQLRDQNAVDLASSLRRTPGVQISRYNPVGAFGGDQGGAVFIRGMGVSRPGSEVKTYIDGIPFYMGLWDHPVLDLLPVNGMQSITVYKSPQPHISGNNFSSINLQTRRANEDSMHGDVRVSGGMHGTFIEQLSLLGRHGKLDWNLLQGHAQSDGHRANADGELNNVMGRIGYQFHPHWSVAASLLHMSNQARDPGDNRVAPPPLPPRYNTQATLLVATLAHTHGDWQGELKLYRSRGDADWLDQPAPDGDGLNRFRMSGLRWQEQLSPWQGGTVLAGIDHDRIRGDVRFNRIAPAPQDYYQSPTFKITSPYLAISHEVALSPAWTLVPSAGVRYYKHSHFPAKTAPHAGLSLVSERLTLFANIARGINYPGLAVPLLSSQIPPLGNSWRQLDAEQMDHREIGMKWQPADTTRFDLSLFHDKIKHRYIFGFPPSVPPPPQFINLGVYSMHGAEVSVQQALGRDWSVFAGFTWLDPSIDNLPYSPKRSVTLGVNGEIGPLHVAIDAQYQSRAWSLNRPRAAGAQNTERVSSFTVANARIAYPVPALGDKGELFVAVENLFDRSYAYRPGYPMPGRWAQIGLTASF